MRERNIVLSEIKSAVSRERACTVEVLKLLREVERDKHFLAMGFSSVFEFAVTELGYSAAAAHRRIQSMRLLRDLPEKRSKIEASLESGELSLCVLAKTQSFIVKENRRIRDGETSLVIQKNELVYSMSGAPVPQVRIDNKTKTALVNSMRGLSARECEKKLIELSPEAAIPREKNRQIANDKTVIQFIADEKLMQKLERLKDLFAHQNYNGEMDKLIDLMADLALKKFEKIKPVSKQTKQEKLAIAIETGIGAGAMPGDSTVESRACTAVIESTAHTVTAASSNLENPNVGNSQAAVSPTLGNKTHRSRYILRHIKRQVWQRDGGRCTYIDSHSGRRCASTHALELDHIQLFSENGPNTAENLRLRCEVHNKYTVHLRNT